MTPAPAVVRRRRRPRVLHLATVDMSLSLLLLPQLVGFRDAGYEVVGASAPGPHVRTLAEHGIGHVPLRTSTRSVDLRADLATAQEFARVCRRLTPDVVHTHNPKPGIYGRVVARASGVAAVVNTVHGLYAQPTDRLVRRAAVYGLERLAAGCSHAELVQNPEDLATLRRLGVPESRLHLLGNGVDLTRFDPDRHAAARAPVRRELGIGEDEIVVGMVGRLVEEKGYREAFEAVRLVREALPDLRILVIGPEEPDKADALSTRELTRAADLGVTFLGMRTDVERLYAAMDMYLLPSRREGFPRAAMEAAAMRLPVIATDVRGCRQVVDQGANGLLVPARDPRAIAEAIVAVASQAGSRRAMGDASRQKAVAEFDDRRQIEITLGVYERLLERQGTEGGEIAVRNVGEGVPG